MSHGPEIVRVEQGLYEPDGKIAGGQMRRPAQVVQFVVLKEAVVGAMVQGNEDQGNNN